MTVAETSPAWFTMLRPFGDESPMFPRRPMRLSTRYNGLVDNSATPRRFDRRYNDGATVHCGAFEHYAAAHAWT